MAYIPMSKDARVYVWCMCECRIHMCQFHAAGVCVCMCLCGCVCVCVCVYLPMWKTQASGNLKMAGECFPPFFWGASSSFWCPIISVVVHFKKHGEENVKWNSRRHEMRLPRHTKPWFATRCSPISAKESPISHGKRPKSDEKSHTSDKTHKRTQWRLVIIIQTNYLQTNYLPLSVIVPVSSHMKIILLVKYSQFEFEWHSVKPSELTDFSLEQIVLPAKEPQIWPKSRAHPTEMGHHDKNKKNCFYLGRSKVVGVPPEKWEIALQTPRTCRLRIIRILTVLNVRQTRLYLHYRYR